MTSESRPLFSRKHSFYGLGVSLCCAYFLWMAWSGLQADITHDDLMNISKARSVSAFRLVWDIFCIYQPAAVFRPVGALYYQAMFAVSGFDFFYYRLTCYGLMAVNILLTYLFVGRITGSRDVALLTAFLHCYHGGFWLLYSNTGACYDILAFCFYIGAFIYYLRCRQEDRLLGPSRTVFFLGLYLLALGSKEIAVTLPVMVLAYELTANPPTSFSGPVLWRWLRREARTAMITGFVTAGFLFGRILAPGSIASSGGYEVDLSISTYLHHLNGIFGEMFYSYGSFNNSMSAMLLTSSLVLVLVLSRKRPFLLFAWLFYAVGVLPVAFIQLKSMYTDYLPSLGIALMIGSLSVAASTLAVEPLRRLSAVANRHSGTVYGTIILAMAGMVGGWHYRFTHQTDYAALLLPEAQEIRTVLDQLQNLQPSIPPHSSILFLKDPFRDQPRWEIKKWATVFIVDLLYGHDIHVERILSPAPAPSPEKLSEYDYVFTAHGLELTQIHPPASRSQ